MDVLKFSFNANSRSRGRFTISREVTDTYSSYRLPKMENSNFSLLEIYSLDFNSFELRTLQHSETEMTLECSNPVKSEIYDWHIVSKSTINPQDSDNKEENDGTITFLAILVPFLIIFMIAMGIVIVVLVVKLRKSKNVVQHETSVNGETRDLTSQNSTGYLTW